MDYITNYDKDKMAKVFKAGNSEAIRLTKKDAELLDLNPGDQVIKEISPDGMSITYKKIPQISQETKKEIANILDEDADLIWALKDL
ncbi:AbrB/MazE/SpoVT family DNA-binding domain-containing protein [Lactobacillus johnsonii]|uniref:AbrB/MazE/SpoVT family DNA-binding domain-containing protein n=1 Tax=Lactobacillus johnsonii TaxID=33959 RepID=UPI003D777EAD